MGKFVAHAAIKQMIKVGKAPAKSKVVILGLTFKENCPDTRNSKVSDVYNSLAEYGVQPIVIDPWASERDAMHEYNIELKPMKEAKEADCVILAVAHNEFKQLGLGKLSEMFKDIPQNEKVLIDVKGLYSVSDLENSGLTYWRL